MGERSSTPGLSWREAIGYVAFGAIFIAAFPRLAYPVRWASRFGPRGLVAYIALNTAVGFALRWWALPYFRRRDEEQRRARAQLRQRLGREPTERELCDHLGVV